MMLPRSELRPCGRLWEFESYEIAGNHSRPSTPGVRTIGNSILRSRISSTSMVPFCGQLIYAWSPELSMAISPRASGIGYVAITFSEDRSITKSLPDGALARSHRPSGVAADEYTVAGKSIQRTNLFVAVSISAIRGEF